MNAAPPIGSPLREFFESLALLELMIKPDPEDDLTWQDRPLPEEPTTAAPGSEEKLRVLEQRAAKRQQLHHPDDVNIKPNDTSEIGRMGLW